MKKEERRFFASAVIVAAGRSSRMNMDVNKQYIEICGKPVIARTIQAFEDCGWINEIILIVNHQDIVYCKQSIVDRYGFRKVKKIVAGGKERQESVYNGLLELDRHCDIVLVHDGARPFISEASIIDSIEAAIEYGAACVAVPAKDTVKEADGEGFVKATPERKMLWMVQTPQTFVRDVICEAHKKAGEEGFIGTDDSVLAERLGYKVKLVMGGYDNIKITTKEDLAAAEAIIGCIGDSGGKRNL